MSICKKEDLDFSNKKIKMIIAGYPGIGKTTLALSSPKPLLIDLDKGVDRVEKDYRTDTLVAHDYNELVNDLKTSDLSNYETLVIDTGGELFNMLKPYVIAENPKNGQTDGSLSQKGYGACAKKFKDFIDFCSSLNKHIIVVFHAKEEKDGDITKLRILIEGQTKETVWQPMDLGGFIEIVGKKRTIGFSNCERYFAKGTRGVKGVFTIPELKDGAENNFITLLFNKLISSLQEESKRTTVYEEAMKFRSVIESVNDVESLNVMIEKFKEVKHSGTSKEELRHLIMQKISQLDVIYDSESKKYVVRNS